MMRSSTLCVLVVGTLLSGACASSGQSSGQVDTSRDLAEMKERILELQEQAAVTEVELERLRALVLSLEGKLEGGSADKGIPSTGRDVESSAPFPGRQVPPPMASRSEDSIEESDLAPPAIPRAADTAAEQKVSTPSGDPPTSPPPAQVLQPVEPAAQALYDRGYTLYHQGKYLDAEASFQRFLQAYPLTELSDNAQFWIGESRYARGDVRGALAAFREVLQKYPEGNKVPDALIKEGDCLAKLGDRDGARDRYDEVRRRFPDSGAAVMAEDRLAGLDG